MQEIRLRTGVVANFPNGESAVMLVAARLRHIAGTRWGRRVYLDMERLREGTNPCSKPLRRATRADNQTELIE